MERTEWTAWVVGEIENNRVTHVGVYTEEIPTSKFGIFQFTIAKGKGASCEEALRRASYNAVLILRRHPEMLQLALECQWLNEAMSTKELVGPLETTGSDPKHILDKFYKTGEIDFLTRVQR